MNASPDPHVPAPVFVAHLEQQIIAHFRAGQASTTPRVRRLRDTMRMAAVLVVGLALGAGSQLASAQVQSSRDRSQLERALEVDRELAVARLALEKDNLDRARRLFEAGGSGRQSLLDATMALRDAEMRVARMNVDLDEIRATSAAPRDELWAPKVGNRDFVKERLQVTAITLQQHLSNAEAAVAEAERGVEFGTVVERSVGAAMESLANATRDFQVLQQKLVLRDRFLKNELTPEQLVRGLKIAEIRAELAHSQRMLALLRARLVRIRERISFGFATALDAKRAEVELLELESAQQRLGQQFRLLDKKEP